MITLSTHRPRNVDAPRAAAILYGDWGTSKAYVIGLAFAVAGYTSFWLIAAMCVLTALVGINYMIICRQYPDGGGVYASVRHRSEVISIVGAFLLVADYLVTAAISSLSAFQYLGAPHPEWFAAGVIVLIGGLNYFGPRHTGGLAFLIAVPTVVVVAGLAAFSVPHLGEALRNVQPLSHDVRGNWQAFVGIVLALSGVEAIANATGVMKLNRGTGETKPCVSRTSTPAILVVMVEVCVFTALLGLAMHALPGLQMKDGDVNAPGYPGVRDYMLKYMAQVFVGSAWGTAAAQIAGWVVSIVIAGLLMSAVNTAIVDLIAIQFLMSRDRELPSVFQRLNQFGVPVSGMLVATIIPAVLVLVVSDMAGLADLYAIGVVGAIAANLGSTSTDGTLALRRWERSLMFVTFVIMAVIEISLFVDKAHARIFAVTILAIGLVLRGLASERAAKKQKHEAALSQSYAATPSMEHGVMGPIMCAALSAGKTLDFALEEARALSAPLFVLFVREQAVLTEEDRHRTLDDDAEAKTVIAYANAHGAGIKVYPCYAVSDSPADTIVDIAATVGASRLILGAPERNTLLKLFRGNLTRRVSELLPDSIRLLICA